MRTLGATTTLQLHEVNCASRHLLSILAVIYVEVPATLAQPTLMMSMAQFQIE